MIKYIIKQLCFCLMCLLLNLNTSLYALEQNSEETQERLLVNESGQPPKEPPMKSPKQPAGMIITENRTDSTGVDLSFPLPVKEDFQDPNLARSVLQVSTLFGLGLAWYYYEKDNQEDQLYNTRSALIERFTSLDAWKFDTNVYETNAVAHPLAGAGYYLIARTNGYSNLESLAFSYAGSAVWEYLIEYMEVVSINDMVFTPIGGIIIGENAYQLASFYAANYSNFFPDWMVSDRSRYAGGLGRNGMASTIWHDLNYQAGVSYFDSGSTCFNLGVDLELYGLRNLKRLGTTRGFTDNAPYSHTVITADVSATEMKRFDMYVETSIFSYINQRIRDTESEAKGYSLILSMNTAWEYDRRIFSGFNDKVGIIHVLGPAVDFSLMKDSFLLRLKSSVFGDFSMIKSLGLMGYLDDGHTNDDVEAKGAHVTAYNGYYYAYGMTTINSVDIEYRNFQIGSELTLNLFWSINGDGRTNREPETGNNFQMEDLRLAIRGWAAYNTDRDVSFRLSSEYRYLEGSARDYRENMDEIRYMLQSVYRVR